MAQQDQNYYELYRATSIGSTLEDTLDILVRNRQIAPQLAMRIIHHFDKSIAEVLNKKVKATVKIKGELDTYRNCDDVWKWVVKNVECTMIDGKEKEEERKILVGVEKMKIVACKAKD